MSLNKLYNLMIFLVIVFLCLFCTSKTSKRIDLNGIWYNYGSKFYMELAFYDDRVFYQNEFYISSGNETFKIINDTLYVFDNDSVYSELFKPKISFISDSIFLLTHEFNIVDTYRRIPDINKNSIWINNEINGFWERQDHFFHEYFSRFYESNSDSEIDNEEIITIKRDPQPID